MSRSKPKPLITWLNSYKILTEFELDPIVSFIQNSSEMIMQKQVELERKYKDWEKRQKEELGLPTAFEVFEHDILEHSKFSSILYNSIFITVYSIMEITLFDICGYTQRVEKLGIKVKDLTGQNYIDKCKKYIKKVLEVDLCNIETLWNTITKYQRIRNSIVHKNGKIAMIKNDLKIFIANTAGIEYDESTTLVSISNNSFVVDFCKIVEKFIHDIIIEIIDQKS